MGYFDEFLAKVPAEDRAVLDRHPELKASIDKMEADLGVMTRYAGEWNQWQANNWDSGSGMTKAEKALQDEIASLQAQYAVAAPKGADPQELDKLRKDFEARLDAANKQQLAAIEGMNYFYQSTAKKLLSHQQEFKETLDPQALMQFMQQHKIQDPDVAYAQMVAPRRAELAEQARKELDTKHAEDVKAAEQRGREQAAREAAMGSSGVLPTDGTGGIAGITAQVAQPAKFSDEVKTKVGEAKLGDGSLAQLGYEMFRRGELPVQ